MHKTQLKAAEYRCRASEATALADASLLHRVREKYEAAAARWMDLALLSDRQSRVRRPGATESLETVDTGA